MKNRFIRKTDDFRQFKTMIFFRTACMAIFAVFSILFLYSFVFYGKFANGVVFLYQYVLRMEYEAALALYQETFREHAETVFIVAMILIFLLVFRIYLNWFAKYFTEINRGIDTLIQEGEGDVALAAELSATEKKINTIKHTLEKRKLDARLAEQRKNDLIVYLAHDLKTPLASVIGYLNLLHDETEISPEQREKYLAISLDKAERLEDLINEFFEIAKFNLTYVELQYSKINLTRLLEQLLYEFGPMLREKQLTCAINAPEDVMLRCDAKKMQRVFDNLLRNAVMYSYEGTQIEIAVVPQGETLSVTFVNHGDTIPPEHLKRIFEQFYRLDIARGTGGGAGLGLAIAKQIVERHGGAIEAESEEERISFKIILPIL